MLEKKGIRRWRRDIWRIFAGQGYQPAEIMAAMVLAGVAATGTDTAVLSELTGLSVEYVTKVLRRLRKQGIVRGQSLRTAWESGDCFAQYIAVALDVGVAAGTFSRFPNEKRSKAQKARPKESYARGPRVRKPKSVGIAPLERVKSNPLYGLPEFSK